MYVCVARPSSGHDRPGEPTESSSCDVTRPISALTHRSFGGSNSVEFYDKFTEAYGIPVLGE